MTLRFRALPHDCDVNLHLNNARYLTLMELGRFALVARLGLGAPMIRRRWAAIAGAMELEFLKEIRILSRFELTTQLVGWDQKWFYLEQRFEREGQLAAIGRVQNLFRGRNRSVPADQVLAELGAPVASPELPAAFQRLASPSPLRKRPPRSVGVEENA